MSSRTNKKYTVYLKAYKLTSGLYRPSYILYLTNPFTYITTYTIMKECLTAQEALKLADEQMQTDFEHIDDCIIHKTVKESKTHIPLHNTAKILDKSLLNKSIKSELKTLKINGMIGASRPWYA